MRPALRLLATVKPRFLESGTPTGLTGLTTHPSPRSQLLYLYSSTLEKLRRMPESSVYRQSTEALIQHRLNIVEATQPAGLDKWQEQLKQHMEKNGDLLEKYGDMVRHTSAGKTFFSIRIPPTMDERDVEWDNEPDHPSDQPMEGTRTEEEKRHQLDALQGKPVEADADKRFEFPPEPLLNTEQIADLEEKIGAGLIEEVIQVAEGEHMLVNTLLKAKVWEELEERPVEGQWTYFARNTHTATQKP